MILNHGDNLQTILLVDDNPMNLDLLKETLDGVGYRLLEAVNGPKALELARLEVPDLILLDIMMPDMDGFDVCRLLREDSLTSDIPVIFLSGLDDMRDKVRGFELGAVDYIAKPFALEEVIARVNTHLTINQLKKKVQKQRDELESELQQVADAQRALLLKDLPDVSGFSLAVIYETSRYAGGDLFDVLPLGNDCWGILIADVEGHSSRAAMLMAMSCALMRSFSGDSNDPAEVLHYLNEQLCKVSSSRIVTAVYAVYDARDKTLKLSRAGHLHPLLYRPTTGVSEIACEGIFPMGMQSYAGEKIPVEEIKLQSGDHLLFYTDGLIEQRNGEDQMYGIDRLKAQLTKAVFESPKRSLSNLRDDVETFAGGRPADDDQTLLLAIVD